MSNRAVRQAEEVDLYVQDEPDGEVEGYDWSEELGCHGGANFLTQEEMKKRGFFDEGRGPPSVSEEELQALDQQAMLTEVAPCKF